MITQELKHFAKLITVVVKSSDSSNDFTSTQVSLSMRILETHLIVQRIK